MAQETTMKAIVQDRYGDLDALEFMDIDTPVVNDDAVLVRVHAAAVGKGDWLTVAGLPYVARLRYGLPKPKHPVPGFDVAGRIEAVGSNVTRLQPGDEVFGWCEGSFAEYASVPEGQLARKPPNLTFEQAAAVPISGFAALQALRDTGGVQPGQRVVIIGASGGVGSFAVQLANVNDGRNLTPWRRVKTDPLDGHGSSVVAAGTRPRSRSLSR
jgi:NADPH:quinone reductase-like Zn-dependent oxidoreductase